MRISSCLTLLAGVVLWTGCSAPGAELAPAPQANEAAMMAAAVNTVDGVRVVAQSQAWPGMAEVKSEVTPLRIVMENNGQMPVRIRYSEFTLVGPQGQRYAALPPYGVEGTVAEPVLVDGYDPVTAPTFEHSNFYVAPYYASAYPTLDPYGSTFAYDSYYYDRTYRAWESISLPTEEMVAKALPEGVLEPGGRIAGFLYFERVPTDVPRVRFRADLVSARDSDEFGEVSIPFVVNND